MRLAVYISCNLKKKAYGVSKEYLTLFLQLVISDGNLQYHSMEISILQKYKLIFFFDVGKEL